MEEPSKSSLSSILNEEFVQLNRLDHSLRSVSSSSTHSVPESSSSGSLKRMASPSSDDDTRRKRLKECGCNGVDAAAEDEQVAAGRVDGEALAEELAQELQCGCCSEIVYKPVIVSPCQHFFCGCCCVLWIKNGGTNCPACRGQSTIVTPSRALQSMVDVLLRAAPQRARTERERMQADEIYPSLKAIKIPVPREPSPEPTIAQNDDYIRPCPHCSAGNPFGWRCPHPISDPASDAEHAWHVDDGTPPGHGYCGHCEVLLAVEAPTTTKCEFCLTSFCGINVQGRCIAVPLMNQHLHRLSDIADLIESSQVYEGFDGNTVEVEIMLDYMTSQRITPRHVYREIVSFIQSTPTQFAALLEHDGFADAHIPNNGTDPNARLRICRWCAAKVFMWGLRDWWIRERKKGFLDEVHTSRKDCPDGRNCRNQSDLAHAREFNHIIMPIELPILTASSESENDGPFPPEQALPSLPSLAELGIPPSALLPRLGHLRVSPTPEPTHAEMEIMAPSSSHLRDALGFASPPHYMDAEPIMLQGTSGEGSSANSNNNGVNETIHAQPVHLPITSVESELQDALRDPTGSSVGMTEKRIEEALDMFMSSNHPQMNGLLDYASS